MATTKNSKAYLSMENLLLILYGGVSSSLRAGWRIIFIRGVEWIIKGETADSLGQGEKGLGGVSGPTLGSRGQERKVRLEICQDDLSKRFACGGHELELHKRMPLGWCGGGTPLRPPGEPLVIVSGIAGHVDVFPHGTRN